MADEAIPTAGEERPGFFRRAGAALQRALPGGEKLAGGRVQGAIKGYLANTRPGIQAAATRASTNYQNLVSERLRNLIDEEQLARSEVDYAAMGRTAGQTVGTPFDFNLEDAAAAPPTSPSGEALPTAPTPDPATAALGTTGTAQRVLATPGETVPAVTGQNWRDYRQTYIQELKDKGVSAREIQAFDRGFTEYQQQKFQELGTAAYNAFELGNTRAAVKLAQAAYQWMPTDNQIEFEERNGQMVAIFRDDETGEVVGAQPMNGEAVLGLLERMKDPKAWYSFTSDKSAKERGELLEQIDRELAGAELEIEAERVGHYGRSVDYQALENAAARATGLGRDNLRMTDISEMLTAMREQEALSGNGGVLSTMQDFIGIQALVEQLVAVGHRPADALELVYRNWGDPNLLPALISAGALPPGGAPPTNAPTPAAPAAAPAPVTGGEFRDGGSVRRPPPPVVLPPPQRGDKPKRIVATGEAERRRQEQLARSRAKTYRDGGSVRRDLPPPPPLPPPERGDKPKRIVATGEAERRRQEQLKRSKAYADGGSVRRSLPPAISLPPPEKGAAPKRIVATGEAERRRQEQLKRANKYGEAIPVPRDRIMGEVDRQVRGR